MKQNTKMMIKAKTQNLIHKIIDPTPSKPKYAWQARVNERFTEIGKMTDAQKLEMLEMFNKIIEADRLGSLELSNYMHDRRAKKRVQKLRDAAIAAGTRKVKVRPSKEEAAKYMANKAA